MFEQARVWKSVRNCTLGLCVVGLTGVVTQTASAVDESLLLRVEARIQDGPSVKVSAPLTIVDVLLGSVAQAAEQSGQPLPINPGDILDQIAQAEGQDIVKVSGEEQNVRIWIEKGQDEGDLKFLKVYAKPDPEENMEVNICVPKGLIEMLGPVAACMPGPMNIGEIMKQMHGEHHPPEMMQQQEEKKMEDQEKDDDDDNDNDNEGDDQDQKEMKEQAEGQAMQDADIEEMVKEIQKEVLKAVQKEMKNKDKKSGDDDEDEDDDQN